MFWPDLCHISHSTVQCQSCVRRCTGVTESQVWAGLHTVSGLRMLPETQQQRIGLRSELRGRGKKASRVKGVLGGNRGTKVSEIQREEG